MMVSCCFDRLNFFIQNESCVFEPIEDDTSPSLVFDRAKGGVTAGEPRVGTANATDPPKVIFGLLGIVNLLAGYYGIIVTERRHVGSIGQDDIFQIQKTEVVFLSKKNSLNEEQAKIEQMYVRMLEEITQYPLYISYSYDLTHSAQRIATLRSAPVTGEDNLNLWSRADPRFFWNRYISEPIIRQKLHRFVIPVIQGYVEAAPCIINEKKFTFILISRRACQRAGTRYNTRGVDAKGNAANYVETEQIVYMGGLLSSFVQLRGSIPVYWQQPIGMRYSPLPRLDQSTLATAPSFRLHFEEQLRYYNKVVVVNLINETGDEWIVGEEFEKQVRLLNHPDVSYVKFDFHEHVKNGRDRLQLLVDQVAVDLELHGYFTSTPGGPVELQTGVFRSNCMDCLDRTNVAQSILARDSLTTQLRRHKILLDKQTISSHRSFEQFFKDAWANNGDSLSQQYSGTGALKNDLTRTGKRSVQGMMNDGVRSLRRYYLSHFRDETRQDAIDLFLGNFVVEQGSSNVVEYSEEEDGCLRFHVRKINRAGAERPCDLVLDRLKATVFFLSHRGAHKRSFGLRSLVKMDKSMESDRPLLTLTFDTAVHTYEFLFVSAIARDRFCQTVRVCQAELERPLPPGTAIARTAPVSIFLGTWNMASVQLAKNVVEGWIPTNAYDIYAIGVQQCQYQPRKGHPFCEADWIDAIQTRLGPDYHMVTAVSLKHIRLIVLCRRALVNNITNVHTATEAVAVDVDKKVCGAVGVVLRIHETLCCFINIFLPTFTKSVDVRNQYLSQIFANLALGQPDFDLCNQFHHTFVFGGFNYRMEIPWQTAVAMAEQGDHTKLSTHCQLVRECTSGRILHGFVEGTVSHAPSLRYAKAAQGTSEKNQQGGLPAWCDRVFWRSYPACPITRTSLQMCEGHSSECAPLTATFDITAQLPFVPTLANALTTQRCFIVVSQLHAPNIKVEADASAFSRFSSLADPYIAVTAPFLDGTHTSSVLLKTLNPRWKEELVMQPFISDPTYLESQHLLLSLWDRNSFRDDTLLGQGAVSLRAACGRRSEPFGVALSLNGSSAGSLYGCLHVRWLPADQTVPRPAPGLLSGALEALNLRRDDQPRSSMFPFMS